MQIILFFFFIQPFDPLATLWLLMGSKQCHPPHELHHLPQPQSSRSLWTRKWFVEGSTTHPTPIDNFILSEPDWLMPELISPPRVAKDFVALHKLLQHFKVFKFMVGPDVVSVYGSGGSFMKRSLFYPETIWHLLHPFTLSCNQPVNSSMYSFSQSTNRSSLYYNFESSYHSTTTWYTDFSVVDVAGQYLKATTFHQSVCCSCNPV